MEKAATRQKNGITGGRNSALKMVVLFTPVHIIESVKLKTCA